MTFLTRIADWVLGRAPLGAIEHWTPERARKAEKETHQRAGRISEPSYVWHAKLYAAYQRERRRQAAQVTVSPFRKRA